jgi:aspartyl-tRNA(Asn)/glutamyl-tRNA(Gln) amidotransferase subunit C
MVRIDPALVTHVAKLAALELTPEEKDAMAGQLTRIVEHFETLRAIPEELLAESGAPPATPLRDDLPRPEAPLDFVAANAPEMSHGHFVVPRVVSRGE